MVKTLNADCVGGPRKPYTCAGCPALAQNRYPLRCNATLEVLFSEMFRTCDWQSQYPRGICVWIQSL